MESVINILCFNAANIHLDLHIKTRFNFCVIECWFLCVTTVVAVAHLLILGSQPSVWSRFGRSKEPAELFLLQRDAHQHLQPNDGGCSSCVPTPSVFPSFHSSRGLWPVWFESHKGTSYRGAQSNPTIELSLQQVFHPIGFDNRFHLWNWLPWWQRLSTWWLQVNAVVCPVGWKTAWIGGLS